MAKKPQALVGGQAVIEGVMMRAPGGVATAVRRPDGSIAVRYDDHVPLTQRFLPFKLPILRGAVTLVESLFVGTGSLLYSAEEASKEEGQATHETSIWAKLGFGAVMLFSFALGLGLFFYLPLILTDLTGIRNGVVYNLVDGVVRLVIFFLYLFAITRWGEMQRVFQYHGAEHMTIFNYEAEIPLTVENSRDRPRLHPRCGTSFLFFVMLVSIFVFATLGRPETVGERLIRIAFVPLIGGLSYEIIRASAKIENTWFGKMLTAPGKGLQLMTTAIPDDTQLEVSVAALKVALTGDLNAHEPDPELAARAAEVAARLNSPAAGESPA
ncbi:MAG: membrane protein [Gemmatimonadota bacterium]|nr:MAG: membrane protein [Gemmatimonadota bacterium]